MAQVRPATIADAANIASAKYEAAANTYRPLIGDAAFETWAEKRCSPEFQKARIEGPGMTVVEDRGRIKAIGFVRPEPLNDEEGGVYLGDFYVVETGAGNGRLLSETLTQQARRQGSYVWTLVFEENTEARLFFEKIGWEKVGSRPNSEVENGVLCEYRRDFSDTYLLIGADGQPYSSPHPGVWGGYDGADGLRLYGRLDCSSARSHIRRGGYVQRRVFFASEEDAIAAGFRPCGRCLRDKYEAWKAANSS